MKKKAIIGILLFFIFLISIDLFIRKPWKVDDVNTAVPSEGTSSEPMENDKTKSTDANKAQDVNETENPETPNDEIAPYFITKNNPYSDLYLNGEFNTNELGLYSEKLEVEDINRLYDSLDVLYEVAHGNLNRASLIGLVDSVALSDEYHPRFNGFMDELSRREQYSIYDSIKIGEGLYKVSVLIQTPAGEGGPNYKNDALLTSVIYNTVQNRLSFEELTRRMPYDFQFEDERYKVYIYMIENYTKGTKLYLSLMSKQNEAVGIENFPNIKMEIMQPHGYEETQFFKINETGYMLVKDVTFYFSIELSNTVDQVTKMEIAK